MNKNIYDALAAEFELPREEVKTLLLKYCYNGLSEHERDIAEALYQRYMEEAA